MICTVRSRGTRILISISKYAERTFASRPVIPNLKSPLKNYYQEEPGIDDKIVIAMSSGVDSSVAAAIYASKYKNVTGIYMANWSQTAKCTERDWNDVQKVCDDLRIPCSRVNFERDYWNEVFSPMISSYQSGTTPNPDVSCNRYIKFGRLFDHLEKTYGENEKWWVVTGHYSRIMKHIPTQKHHLLRAPYSQKDQSYYLSSISQRVLPRVLLPMGHLTKPQVRQLAEEFELHVSQKPDSQGLCFVSQEETNFRDFLNEYIEPNPGNIVTEDGKVWGKHTGLWHATVGQKCGISMPQGDPKYKGMWFVSKKNVEKNELVIVKGTNNPSLFHDTILVDSWSWIDENSKVDEILADSSDLTLQFRSLQEPIKVDTIVFQDPYTINIKLATKARAMAPGQNIVLYKNTNHVLGSGVLKETLQS